MSENDWMPRTAMGQALKNLTTDTGLMNRAAAQAYTTGGTTWQAGAFMAGFKQGLALLADQIADVDRTLASAHEYWTKVAMACMPRATVFPNDGSDPREYGSTLTQAQVADIVSKSTGIDLAALEWTEASGGLELWVRMPERAGDGDGS